MSAPSITGTSSSNASSTRSAFRHVLGKNGSEDPLARVLAPPPNETLEERVQRQKSEEKARKLSEDIDKYLKKDGELQKEKRKAVIRLLLLGQSESGKSTALKNFQLLYNPQSFQAERLAWRLVIIFNLVHSIRILHHVVSEALMKQQQDEEDADSRDVLLGKSPTSPLFTRAPLPDFQDLLPPPEAPQSAKLTSPSRPYHNHRNLSLNADFNTRPSSPLLSPVPNDFDLDLHDAASSHSTGSSSHLPKVSTTRQGSLFSSSKPDKKSRTGDRKRPSTTSGYSPKTTNAMGPTNAFCLPTSTGGSGIPMGSKRTPPGTKTRGETYNDDESKPNARRDASSFHRSRSRSRGSFSGTSARPKSLTRDMGSMESNDASLVALPPRTTSMSVSKPLQAPYCHHDVPPPQTFPDLRWGPQHRILLMRLKPLLMIETDLLRRLSAPEEEEPLRLDFNLPEMRNAAVRAAVSSSGTKRSMEEGAKRSSVENNRANASRVSGRPISATGRPRARSSVDIRTPKTVHGAEDVMANRLGNGSTTMVASLDHPFSFDRRRSDDLVGPISAQAYGDSPNIATKARVLVPSGEGVVIPEFFIRSTVNWKEKLKRLSKYDPTGQLSKGQERDWNPWDDEMDPAHFIQACASDVMALWNDPVVQGYLRQTNFRVEHYPGFFLTDVERITARNYVPTDDDILRARIKTIGVTEHKLTINAPSSVAKEWLVYDVGGARTQRAAWLPYFDTADAILFIASLSSFDQVLSEDPTVNRMEDSLRLFRTIVSSPILKDINIILFLNKIDLLEAKIQAGIKVGQHFKRYADRPNTAEAVCKYFRSKFLAIFEKFTPPHSKRVLHIYNTSLTNPKSSKIILEAVSESIIQAHLRNQRML